MELRAASLAEEAALLAKASGISAMQTYPARRAMYSQSTTAKYASVTRMMPAITSRDGATRSESERQRHSGGGDAESDQVRQSGPCAYGEYWSEMFPRKSDGGGERANASSPSRTANMPASDSNQFSASPAMQINPASGRKRMKARPGRGCAVGRDEAGENRRADKGENRRQSQQQRARS